ncbi:EcsC family protein [Sporolactobacillus terrae]|uniref:ABC transporter-associated protein EcsC n=1 Tax=Sporolactobacillus terrae TaxID=269673 RepID=A0A410D5Y1_9BACL|nr:EcsC family protein [Sporolactobacillus terrae]QAA21518.1 EcsC family protein [Sporolactobacillus terrae]QAA24490.1 EcsC family protein [Sporolactobacillus terrae]UAK16320.1 EcsC family protein [Sporolactobacillus terrae]BBN97803.1 ABC transporter-associated protein EcsC [Sporolactobacillus terrae]
MNDYELKAYDEIMVWKRKMRKPSNLLNRMSKKVQAKINGYIPDKVMNAITVAIKNMVQACLNGSQWITKKDQAAGLSLEEKDQLLTQKLSNYRKTAVVEGAGTGAGGILLGLADFPLLLSIKMKFLFDAASVYGFDTKEYAERVFILQVFKLAFSSDEVRDETLAVIEHWETRKQEFLDLDWEEFQQEYRDYLDFAKMLQLMPGIGAAVGAVVNYNLLDRLGETAKNCYRLRLLSAPPKWID